MIIHLDCHSILPLSLQLRHMYARSLEVKHGCLDYSAFLSFTIKRSSLNQRSPNLVPNDELVISPSYYTGTCKQISFCQLFCMHVVIRDSSFCVDHIAADAAAAAGYTSSQRYKSDPSHGVSVDIVLYYDRPRNNVLGVISIHIPGIISPAYRIALA